MEIIRFALAIPLGLIALFFLYIGSRRGERFSFHDYQGDDQERLRDNFFSAFTMFTSLSCLTIMIPLTSWRFAIPFILLLILIGTPMLMLGFYLKSFLANVLVGLTNLLTGNDSILNNGIFWKKEKDISSLEWYEFTPFALVSGWIVYYLVYLSFLLILGFKIDSDNAPVWVIFVGLTVGIITAVLLTIGIHRKFKNA
jgi:hypothetical protein